MSVPLARRFETVFPEGVLVDRTPAGSYISARIRLAAMALIAHRRTLLETSRAHMFRSLLVASAICTALFVVAILLAPLTRRLVVRVQLPEPTTRITLLEELIPEALAPPPLPALQQVHVRTVVDPTPEVAPAPPRRRIETRPLDPEAARLGRERAREVTEALARATGALDQTLAGLSSSLDQAIPEAARRTRQRAVRSGRAQSELAAIASGPAGVGTPADLRTSTVRKSLIAVETLAPPRPDENPRAAEGTRAAGSAPGVHRSNASLLAVIQKYAAGIQYCYDNELKRDASLRGKLVVALTVAPSGRVLEATVVKDGVASDRLTACALSQIREWRFPAIAEGVTSFQAPFVFTPPN